MDAIKLLAISGSLRKHSYNQSALLALKQLSPSHIHIKLGDISQLPLFNPDLESQPIAALQTLKQAINDADGLIIASPEYAHGISGPMKNALDWLVSGMEFPDKPIMLINTSPRASHAQAALIEVLTTMSGNIIHGATTTVPLLGRDLTASDINETAEISEALVKGLDAFYDGIQSLNEL